jgi:uncharacterized protein (TIGR01777 family)
VRIAISGGTGMVGTWLANELRDRGDEVLIITRRPPASDHDVQWNPRKGGIVDLGRLEGVDAVFGLAGAPIADRPWTKARRAVLWESRVDATRVLLESLRRLDEPPATFIGVGGMGRFGDRDEEIIDDDDPRGEGFLADLSVAWEEAQLASTEVLGSRSAVLRMSIILSPTGGVFPLMVKPFRLGFGGWLGHGRQYTSWLSIRDAVGALLFLLDNPDCRGGFNGTVPEPTRNKEWCKALGRTVHRPVITHAPRWALRGALGDLAEELLIASCRAVPRKLSQAGFKFRDPDCEATYAWLVSELDNPDAMSKRHRVIPARRR